MLSAIVRFSVHHRGAVVALALGLMAYGGYALSRAGLDIFPEFSPKQVVVQTEAPGLAAEQVETLVSRPIETALGGIIGLERLRSESIQGLSIVTAVFTEDTDIFRDRQLVAERLALVAPGLPPGVGPPVPVPLESSSATVLTIGVTGAANDLMALRDLVDATVVPRIMAVPGVADVNVFGGVARALEVAADPIALAERGLGMDALVQGVRAASAPSPGGFVDTPNQRLTVVAVPEADTPAGLAALPLAGAGGTLARIGEVARVGWGAMPARSAATALGQPAVLMMVLGQYGANTLTVSRAVEAALAELEPALDAAGVRLHPRLFRPANYIETSIRNLTQHLAVGAGFVMLVLLVFLFDARAALISALAIPLSLLGAVVVLLEQGVNLNVMVIGGLAIALGEVVDDAIIDTENIFRRLRENLRSAAPRAVNAVVHAASMEVRGSVVYASFIVALVFVPLLTLGGVAGRLFSPLGYSYILAVLVSLGVALTVTPALGAWLLGARRRTRGEPPLVRWLSPVYARLLAPVLRSPGLALGATLTASIAVCALLPGLGMRLLPELREGHYIVHTSAVAGTTLAETMRIGSALTRAWLAIPGVRSVSQWAGRAELGADTFGSHYAEYEVDLEPMSGRGQQRVLEAMRGVLAEFPGLDWEVNTFLTERVDETLSGYTSPVVVQVVGTDLEVLDRRALAVAEVLRSLPGAEGVRVRAPPSRPLLRIVLDAERLATHGIGMDSVLRALRAATAGVRAGARPWAGRWVPVLVTLPAALRDDPVALGAVPLRAADGHLVRLGEVADITIGGGRYNVVHQDGQRVQTVTARVAGGDLDGFLRAARSRLAAVVPAGPEGYLRFTGAAVEQARAREQLLVHALVASAGVVLLMYLAVGGARQVVLMLLNLPFALIGGVLAAIAGGGVLSVGSLVGFVTLFGITVRNAIMLVSHYRHLVLVEGRPWDAATAVLGAQQRLPSILMTALVTALAMLPIALDSDNPGREIMGPMAAIIIGGLASSTLLNLLVLPAVVLRWGRFEPVRGEGP